MTPKKKPLSKAEAEGKWDAWYMPVTVTSVTMKQGGILPPEATITVSTIGGAQAELLLEALSGRTSLLSTLLIEKPRAKAKRGRRA